MRPRREFEIISLSFMDLICCGLGGILILMLVFSSFISSKLSAANDAGDEFRGNLALFALDCGNSAPLTLSPEGDLTASLLPGDATRRYVSIELTPGRSKLKIDGTANAACTVQRVGPRSDEIKRRKLPISIRFNVTPKGTRLRI